MSGEEAPLECRLADLYLDSGLGIVLGSIKDQHDQWIAEKHQQVLDSSQSLEYCKPEQVRSKIIA
jgi:hypothetical protein